MAAVAGFQTSGIDMYITPERMVLLDTEPIYCLSNLENAHRNERIADGVPVDMWLDHQALVMATFLFSVCNVVLVMTDNRPDGNSKTLKLLQRVEVFMKALSAMPGTLSANPGVQGAGAGSGQPSIGQDGFQREGLGEWCADIGKGASFDRVYVLDDDEDVIQAHVLNLHYGPQHSFGIEQSANDAIRCRILPPTVV